MTAAPIKVIPNNKLFVSEPNPAWFGNGPNEANNSSWTNKNWLKSRFHFSFAEYSSAKNSNYGVLRVMNDDLVQPHRGFGTHPHQNMEIITYIVEGKLTHKDTLGTSETLGRGSVQFMTAGQGIRHSEFNNFDKPLRFIQTWIAPSAYGLEPNYGSFSAKDCKRNAIQHMVSNLADTSTSSTAPVKINQDANMFTSELELGKKVALEIKDGRQAYLLCVEGSLKVNGEPVRRHDACEIGPGMLEVEAHTVEATESGDLAHFVLFEMKRVVGSGRKDL